MNNFCKFYTMELHVGQIIEQKFQESGIKLSVFAERINTGERNVYSIFKRKDINAGMLKDISEVLDFNFFDLYAPATSPVQKRITDPSITISLQIEIPKMNLNSLSDFLREVEALGHKFEFKIL